LDHLRKVLPQYKIVTKEISGHESPEDIKKEHFSFLISSAGFYASFDPSSAGLRQIATRHDARAKTASESIGSTIIALTDRNDLNRMEERSVSSRETSIRFPAGSVPKENLPIASELKKISRTSSVRSTVIRTSTRICFQTKQTPPSFRPAN
jgi:hypothetical protein